MFSKKNFCLLLILLMVFGTECLVRGEKADFIVTFSHHLSADHCPYQETALGDLIADALKSAMEAEIALVPAAAIDKDLPEGKITKDYFSDFSIFNDDTLILLNLNGKQIKEVMEFSLRLYPKESKNFLQISGIKFKFDPSKKVGEKIVEINFINSEGQEEPLSEDRLYKVATLRFLALGEIGYFRVFNEKEIIKFTSLTYREAIIDYLKKLKTISFSPDDKKERIKVVKASEESRED